MHWPFTCERSCRAAAMPLLELVEQRSRRELELASGVRRASLHVGDHIGEWHVR